MSLQLLRMRWGQTTGCFIYDFVFQVISDKALCSKDFTSCLRDILDENNCNFNFSKWRYKLGFIPFVSFHMNQKQETIFYKVCGLATKKFIAFAYSESHSTSKRWWIEETFLKRFSRMLFLLNYSFMIWWSFLWKCLIAFHKKNVSHIFDRIWNNPLNMRQVV